MNNTQQNAVTHLKVHYDGLSKKKKKALREFVKISLGKSSRSTFFYWLTGKYQPTKIEKERIAKHLKIDVNVVFN